ncbi:MAG: S8 family serine peptidase, partial [Verrucomicrobiales bacterium]
SQDFVEDDGTTGTEINGHGTAVASVAAGTHAAAPGVAPAAQVLSFRVADSDGNSDSFTLAQGILAAAEAGADVINISLGSTGDSGVVEEAVNKAMAAGSTIVAAAGNNGADSLSYPAAYEGVISVGSVDAAGQHLDFSNTAESLNI